MANNMNIQITTLLLIVLFHSNLIGMEIAPENRYTSKQLDISLLKNLFPEIQQQILSHITPNQWWYLHCTFKHDDWVYSVCFDPSGKQLATGSYKKARIFDIAQQQSTASFKHDSWVYSVCFDPSGKQLATGSDTKAQIFDIAQQQSTASFEHDDSVRSVCFDPSGKQLATGSYDKKARIFRQYTSYTLEQITLKHALLTWLLLEKPDKNIAQLNQTDFINRLCDQISNYKIINVFIPDIIPQDPSNDDLLKVWYSFPEEMQQAIIRTLQHKIKKYGK